MIKLATSLALRDLRGGTHHLRLLFITLALGVAVMCCIGQMIAGVRAGIDRDAKSLLGGDIEIRQIYNEIPLAASSYLVFNSKVVSRTMDMRAMAEYGGKDHVLIELKGVERNYPLFGKLELKKPADKDKELFFNDQDHKIYGAAVDQSFLDTMKLKVGDRFNVGDATLEIQAVIAIEPDRSVSGVPLGPRVMTSRPGFEATKLVKYGSMVNYRYRLQLKDGETLEHWKAEFKKQFPDAHWNMQDWHESAPGLTHLIDRLSLFFSLTGITTLIVAGLGISNSTGVYMWSKRETVAAMKCLGASHRLVQRVYFVQLLIVGAAAIAAGLLIGTVGELALMDTFGDLLPVRGERGIYSVPVLLSAGLGFLNLLLFGLLPLWRTHAVKPSSLFRGTMEDMHIPSLRDIWRERRPVITGILLITSMVVLSVFFTGTVRIPLYFAIGLLFSMAAFYGISELIRRGAKRDAHSGKYKLRKAMALANLARPGAATSSMVIALGISMSLLIALTQVGGNLRKQLEVGLPEHAPAFFLLDIQPSRLDKLVDELSKMNEVTQVTHNPIVRGRIIKLNGTPVDQLPIDDSARWAIRGERGLTWMEKPPENSRIIEGKWWPEDYYADSFDQPLVSFDANLARGMGLKIGDNITFAAIDKEITAKIANLRDVQWGSMDMNFAVILARGSLDELPITHIATVRVNKGGEKVVQDMVGKDFPQVGIVRVQEALGKISDMMQQISNAILVTAAMTIACSTLVMASAIHASLHKRMFDTVMLKVLGVTRRRIMGIYLTEFTITALASALAAILIGSLAAWGIMQLMILSTFELIPQVIAITLVCSIVFSLLLGVSATHKTLKIRPLALLRNE